MGDFTFDIKGLDELKAKMQALSGKDAKKTLRFGLRKAANIVAADAKQKALGIDDQKTGRSIAQNIAVRYASRMSRQPGIMAFRVGVLYGAKLEKGLGKGAGQPTPHWRLLEFGTEKMRAQPFMRQALENNAEKCADVFVAETNKAIDRVIKRNAKAQ